MKKESVVEVPKEKEEGLAPVGVTELPIKFTLTEVKIAKWKREYLTLSVSSLEDKEAYGKVKEGHIFIKKQDGVVETERKLQIAAALEHQRKVNKAAGDISALIEPIKVHLAKEREKFETWEAEAKQKKEQEEREKLRLRAEKLLASGMTFTGYNYAYGEHSITIEQIKAVSDDFIDSLCGKVEAAVKVENARLVEEERLKEEEKEAERLRLKAIEDARLEAERKEREELEVEKKRLAKIKKDLYDTAKAQREKDEAFEKEKKEFDDKKKADGEARLKEEAEKKPVEEPSAPVTTEEVEKNILDEEGQAGSDEVARIESEEQIAIRAAKEKELRPDREKLKAYADKLEKVAVPKLKTPECQAVLDKAYESITGAITMLLREGS